MHTLKIKVKDSVYDKVQYFLENLPKDDVEVVSDDIVSDSSESIATTGYGKAFIKKWSGIISEDSVDFSRIDYLSEKYK